MHYRILTDNPATRYFRVECHLSGVQPHQPLHLQLPTWRPGRYELQHFAKNIQRFTVTDGAGRPLPFRKLTTDRWVVEPGEATNVVAQYTYYANVVNAGSSYVDDDWWYINPVNLCLYAEGRLHEPCTLELGIPDGWTVACGLAPLNATTLQARDFYELIDCPLIAAPAMQRIGFDVAGVAFTVWVQGSATAFDPARIRADFSRFAAEQIRLFGRFPEPAYHFLTIVLPTAYYHGVEHRNSTVLVLGPADEGEGLYVDLLGVSAHELFHAWNIIRIRPIEMLPYDLTKPNFFPTGFVAEGVTTYYGDLMLRRAGVFDDGAYLKELHVLLKRHFEVSARAAQSLVESSWDLWLDGYERGIPDRKVSIYHKGALVALILDLHLRRKFNHARSLDDVMRRMWAQFGEPFVGYTLADYRAVTEAVAEEPLDWYYDECIWGNQPLEHRLNDYLHYVGLHMHYDDAGGVLLDVVDDPAAQHQRERWLTT